MNIEKYIELLRFYLTEKIDEVNRSVQKTIQDEIADLLSSIISSILAIYISTQFIEKNGLGWAVLKVFVLIIVYLLLYFLTKWIIRKYKTQKELGNANNKRLSDSQFKKLVSDFDHIACDSILLSWDFLKKIYSKRIGNSEKNFCLIESIYYFKKAISIISLVVTYKEICVNSGNVSNAISPYRIKNASESLKDISTKIEQAFEYLHVNLTDDIADDYKNSLIELKKVTDYADGIVNHHTQ